MEHYSILDNRVLFFDGTSVIEPTEVPNALLDGIDISNIAVTKLTDEIINLNKLLPTPIQEKTHCNPLDLSWNIPDQYKQLDLEYYFFEKCKGLSIEYLERVAIELVLFEEYGLNDLLKTLIFLIDEFKNMNIVWGIGRGSSCSSLLLYLIDLHMIDPIKYNIEITDFLREK